MCVCLERLASAGKKLHAVCTCCRYRKVVVVGCYSSGLYSNVNATLVMKILGGMHVCDGEEEECLCGTTTSHVQLQ